jgi:hypothetical protein
VPWDEIYTWPEETYGRLAKHGLTWQIVLNVLLYAWPLERRDVAHGWTVITGQASDGRWVMVLVGAEMVGGERPVLDARELVDEREIAEARRRIGGSDGHA